MGVGLGSVILASCARLDPYRGGGDFSGFPASTASAVFGLVSYVFGLQTPIGSHYFPVVIGSLWLQGGGPWIQVKNLGEMGPPITGRK